VATAPSQKTGGGANAKGKEEHDIRGKVSRVPPVRPIGFVAQEIHWIGLKKMKGKHVNTKVSGNE
jgi:hypothetical protein